jgi:lysyl-tRNA synthetase, class I
MHWADKIVREIIASGKYKPYWVDDMTTPSGYAHTGSIRGPLIHDLIFKLLRDAGEKATNTYVFNDFDPIDGLPVDLQEKFSKYMGFPLCKVPSPELGYEDFGEYFAKDFQKILRKLGIESEFIFSWDLYSTGKFDEVIKTALDNAEKIQDIYQKVSGSKKKEQGWLPFQVICEKCGKIGTTRVFKWDGKEVSYKCEPAMVTWAKGCGYEGKMSPFGGKGKLPWKVDWPAHWKVMGVTIEGSGKEHSSAGGSRDIAKALCEEVFDYPDPFNIKYEYFLIGGKKMSSSKGLGLRARDVVEILPPELVRFLFLRTDYKEQIEFNPDKTMVIPDLFDEYDKAQEEGSRSYVLSQITKVPEKEKEVFAPRFRDIANYLSQGLTEGEIAEKTGGTSDILEERIKYVKVWLENYAPSEFRFEMTKSVPESAKKLSAEQKKYLGKIIPLIDQAKDGAGLQISLYELSKSLGVPAKDAFGAIYISLIGKTHGPRAGVLILNLGTDKVTRRLKEVSDL